MFMLSPGGIDRNRNQGGSRKKMGRTGGKEAEKGEDVRSKENSRRVRDLG